MPDSPTTLPSLEGRCGDLADAAAEWAVTILHTRAPALIGRRYPLAAQLRFGRDQGDDVDLPLDDPKLSRHHATITRAGSLVELRDHDSRNGSFVNGARVAASALVPGDVIRVGDTLLELVVAPPHAGTGDSSLVGTAPAFIAAVEVADRVAMSDLPVLVLGETGTGKDVLAHRMHARRGRGGDFVAVNCAAIPSDLVESTLFGHVKGAFTGATSDRAGLFVEARGGTLFLDEVGELPLEHQAKLLRALDANEITPVGGTRRIHCDARVIAATNSELPERVAAGAFRADLYARLAGAVIRMPPLRARRGDILVLARSFLADPHERRLSAQAAERLLLHAWPRNIRELASAMRRLELTLADGAEIRRSDIDEVLEPVISAPAAAAGASPERAGHRDRARPMPTRDELIAQLVESGGNVSQLARHYGKDAKQIYRWLAHHALDPDSYRPV